jgi:hypothetical protein
MSDFFQHGLISTLQGDRRRQSVLPNPKKRLFRLSRWPQGAQPASVASYAEVGMGTRLQHDRGLMPAGSADSAGSAASVGSAAAKKARLAAIILLLYSDCETSGFSRTMTSTRTSHGR